MEITTYFHCRSCMPDRPPDTSPRSWSRLEAGVSKEGYIIVHCYRCEMDVFNSAVFEVDES